jgi:hypothetical protein
MLSPTTGMFEIRPDTWHPTLKGVYDHWVSIHPPGRLPGRQHLDPSAIARLLPNIFLVDVCRDPLRFRYRLIGTEYVRLIGRDVTNAFLDEVHPGFHDLILRQYEETSLHGRPAYRKGPIMYTGTDERYLGMERVIMPLARNGVDVEMILGAVVYIPASKQPRCLV